MSCNVFWQKCSAPSFSKAFSHQMWQIKLALISVCWVEILNGKFFLFIYFYLICEKWAAWPSSTRDISESETGINEIKKASLHVL